MALLYALFATMAAAVLVSSMMTVTLSNNKQADLYRSEVQSRYLAEGAVEAAKKSIQNALANWRTPAPTGFAMIGDVQVDYTITDTGFEEIITEASGIQSIVNQYEIQATAEVAGSQVVASRLINAVSTPIFQFAVFYNNDCEINPGPNMELGGRIHSNGDIYLGCGGTLTCNTNYVRAVGSIYRSRKDDPNKSEGKVLVRRYVENPFDAAEPEEYGVLWSRDQMSSEFGLTTDSGYDSAFVKGFDENADGDFNDEDDLMPWVSGALEYFQQPEGYTGEEGNTLMASEQGVTEAVTLEVGSVALYDEVDGGRYEWDATMQDYLDVGAGNGTHNKGFYHDKADLSVIQYPDGSWKAWSRGVNVTLALSLLGAVKSSSLYDGRQAAGGASKQDVLEIDISKLNLSGLFPLNGLLYAAPVKPGQGVDAGGVLLTGGSELLAPLTVVSQSSVYVQGDYNTKNKKGAAVIADAVNLLSNSWDNSKTSGSLPKASETTFNMAMVTGNHDTVGSTYNGGLENLPRFHESWSGVNCNIVGSLVNVWTSSYATGKWKYGGDRYEAPNRIWSYDEDFNQVPNLPPYTPMVVTAEDVVSW